MRIEKISAVTLKVASMRDSVRFYKDVLGMEIIYGGEDGCFSSLCAKDANTPILNLEQGHSVFGWGRRFSTWRTLMHSGNSSGEKGSSQRVRETRHGASGISTCQIRMATSCRSRVRSGSLSTTA
jgi:catechol 2,3-dioxygenase-like lactoylglutathione lyase family enzyme